MDKIRKFVDNIVEKLSAGILGVMTLLVTWQVITRFVFKAPSTITEALAKYMFLWLVMVTAAYVIGKRDHMNLQFFVNRFSEKTQAMLGIVSEAVILLFVLIVLGYGGGFIALNAMQQMDSALPVPIGVVYLALPACGILSAFYAICNINDLLKKIKAIKQGGQQ